MLWTWIHVHIANHHRILALWIDSIGLVTRSSPLALFVGAYHHFELIVLCWHQAPYVALVAGIEMVTETETSLSSVYAYAIVLELGYGEAYLSGFAAESLVHTLQRKMTKLLLKRRNKNFP